MGIDLSTSSKVASPPIVGGVAASQVMAVRLLHPEKALFPMLITLAGMVMVVSPSQPSKAEGSILVTSSGMIVVEHPAIRALLLVSMMALHPPRES